MTSQIRLGADIGGTFTDIALETPTGLHSTKVLTNYVAPEQGILDGIDIVLAEAGLGYRDLEIVIHGTTLATNALIERRGARVAFVTTEGFRDVIEMRTESRTVFPLRAGSAHRGRNLPLWTKLRLRVWLTGLPLVIMALWQSVSSIPT
jgi:N-methylhydantoinase A/oxoprolinase/acetone carboxylase beta subunit